jgi:hypothetical protein
MYPSESAVIKRHPFETRPRKRRRLLLICFTVAAVLPVALGAVTKPLHEDVTGESIVDFELAGSVDRATDILAAWESEDVIGDAKAIQVFDLVYPLIYSFALAGLCVGAAGAWRRRGYDGWARIGIAMAWVAFAAAAFDYVENLGLMISLWDEPHSPWPQVSKAAAIVKFTGIYASLAYALTGIVAWALSTRGSRPASGRPRRPSRGSPSAG